MAILESRRSSLRTAPLAAAVSLTLTESLLSAPVEGQDATNAAPAPFQLFTMQSLESAEKALQSTPGNKSLIDVKQLPVTVVMTSETAKAGKEFEWHEGRDHIVQIMDGATLYEVGGTPKNGHNTKPEEWLAPESEGHTTYSLKKGDMLFIPRNTPHKRSTSGSVSFLLISTVGSPKA